MVRTYAKAVAHHACRKTVHDVAGNTPTKWLVRLGSVGIALAASRYYVTHWDKLSPVLSDTEQAVLLSGCGLLALVVGGLVLNLLIVAPYQIWKGQADRIAALDAPLEIFFSPVNEGKKFWSTESVFSEAEDRRVVYSDTGSKFAAILGGH